MEAEEKRWREVEAILRRLIGRLCAAGMGVDPTLDGELSALASANRLNAPAEELAKFSHSLIQTVAAVDAVAPVRGGGVRHAAAAADAQTRAAIAALLQRLPVSEDASRASALLSALAEAKTDAAMAAVIVGVAGLVHERGEQLARERSQAAQILSDVTQRLGDMAAYLTEAADASHTRFDDAKNHNDTVMWQVRELNSEVSNARELGVLQSLVAARLERVVAQVCGFRAREEDRLLEYSGRAEQMRLRIADLEREARDLKSTLANAEHDARLDPLTGIANRKSFDERFGREILQDPRSQPPLVILLWDIDSFKAVNDTYGHRAGDRVLQSVASCLVAAARGDDFVARVGGEEFVVLLQSVGFTEAMAIADELREAIGKLRFHFRGVPVRVTASCGLTQLQDADSPDAAFDRADAALYKAKHSGKNSCVAA